MKNFEKVSDVLATVFAGLLAALVTVGLVGLVAPLGGLLGGHMIYIYLGVAFVLAGGGWFIGFHQGHRAGRRGRNLAEYRAGYIDGSTLGNPARIRALIDNHLEIMDSDE